MKTIQSIKVQGWVKVLPLCLFTLMPLNAQDRLWSLSECEDYAVAHNITIKQKEKAVEKQVNNLSTAVNSRLPNLTGTVGQNFNFGRYQSPADNVDAALYGFPDTREHQGEPSESGGSDR